ncbi:MAG: SHOCT domain-containing protein [Alphaproteobacteria bacterium]|nr:SHOCT domain-containing protein [Alphaproteobacteria bacterium]
MAMAWFLMFAIAVLCIVALVFVIQIPILIARGRGISGAELTTITVLSWCGIFLGITWLVALVLALVWPTSAEAPVGRQPGQCRGYAGDLSAGALAEVDIADKLEKLHKLKQKGIISQKEFDAEKKKILG